MIIAVLYYIFVAVAVTQILYYLSFSSFAFAKSKQSAAKEIPISVIVCAKNEEQNLQELVPQILNQQYTNFQLVLINDASSDDTLEVMERFQQQDDRIKIVNVQNNESFWGNKKYALTLGIKAAKHEHLLFTDADCRPVSKKWILRMARNFSEQKSIVLGYGKYKASADFSWVNLLVRYETMLTALQYFSYAKLNSPYMAVGRNFAYTKSEFFKVNGFIKHIKVRSGDDDLFLQEAANNTNTTIEFSPNSHTISEPPKLLKEWFRQKRRHISTAKLYKKKHKLLLGLFFISKFLLIVLTPLLFFFVNWQFVAIPFLSYLLIEFLIFGFTAKKLNDLKVVLFLPILEIFLVLFQFVIFIANTISKPTHWK